MNPRLSFGGWMRFAQTVQGSAGNGLGWAESLNFVGPRVRISFWSWALLALGAIAVVHALELARQVDAAGQAAHAELERLQRHAQSSGAPALPATGASRLRPMPGHRQPMKRRLLCKTKAGARPPSWRPGSGTPGPRCSIRPTPRRTNAASR
jgi:hypothetical protein